MTNGGTEDIHRLLYDVWVFIRDAEATKKVDLEKLSKAMESFKKIHEKTYARPELEQQLGDDLQRCLGTYPYW